MKIWKEASEAEGGENQGHGLHVQGLGAVGRMGYFEGE